MKENNFIIISIVILLSLIFYVVGTDLLYSSLVAMLLFLSMHKFNLYLKNRLKKKIYVAIISTFVVIFLFYAFISYALYTIIPHIQNINIDKLSSTITNIIDKLSLKIDMISPNISNSIQKIILNSSSNTFLFVKNLTTYSANFMINIIIISILYFLISIYDIKLLLFIKNILPISKKNFIHIKNNITNTLHIVLYSIIITAILEGFLFGVISSFFGFNGIILGIIYGFCSLIPIIGGIIVWVPVVIYSYFIENDLKVAIIIALYSIIVISIIADTLVKPLIIYYVNKNIIKSNNRLNEFLIFLAMLIGIGKIGFWGVLISPALLAITISILDIFSKTNKKVNGSDNR